MSNLGSPARQRSAWGGCCDHGKAPGYGEKPLVREQGQWGGDASWLSPEPGTSSGIDWLRGLCLPSHSPAWQRLIDRCGHGRGIGFAGKASLRDLHFARLPARPAPAVGTSPLHPHAPSTSDAQGSGKEGQAEQKVNFFQPSRDLAHIQPPLGMAELLGLGYVRANPLTQSLPPHHFCSSC